MTIPDYLLPSDDCKNADPCYGNCSAPVKDHPATGRWYITMGHPGFNSPANNNKGYVSSSAALAALKKYGSR